VIKFLIGTLSQKKKSSPVATEKNKREKSIRRNGKKEDRGRKEGREKKLNEVRSRSRLRAVREYRYK